MFLFRVEFRTETKLCLCPCTKEGMDKDKNKDADPVRLGSKGTIVSTLEN